MHAHSPRSKPRPGRGVWPLVLALGACTTPDGVVPAHRQRATLSQDPAQLEVWTLRAIEVHTRDIYSDEEAQDNAFASLLNATHRHTREVVVRREFWIAPGEPIRGVDAAELERNLRATGLFAEVRAVLRPTETPGVADLVVETEDKVSLAVGASGSYVGNVASLGTALSEGNLFGYGDDIGIGYSKNSQGEFRGALSYFDRHFLGSWVVADGQVGRTEEGDFAALRFERPFKHLSDSLSWRVDFSSSESAVDYYEAGESIAEVPQKRDAVDGAVFRRFGPAERSWTIGLHGHFSAVDSSPARGPGAGAIDVPGDTETTLGAVTFGHRTVFGFREVQGLDTLDFVQDVSLSAGFEGSLGTSFRSEVGEPDATQPTVGLSGHYRFEPWRDTFLSLGADGHGRLESGDFQGWDASLNLTAFELSLQPHTLGARFAFDEAYEGEALPVQFTLGEREGLRGYPTREFSGSRVMRMNFEDRLDLNAKLGPFAFGTVAFFDAGWIEEHNEGFGGPLFSTGLGLRVGSDSLFGPKILRIDVSVPLSERDGVSYDPIISASFGQVFGF